MAVRVRKLAKDLQRTPAAVVGMLHALGQSRYRSADDMIPAALEESVWRAFSRGLRPVEVVLVDAPPGRPQAAELAPKPPEDDLMSRLVPGVSRPGVRVAPVPAVPAPRPAPVGAPAPERGTRGMGTAPAPSVPVVVSGGLEGELRRIETERAALDSHARRLASEAALLASERLTFAEEQAAWADRIASLDEERASLASLGEALSAERAALDAERAALTALADRARGHGGIELATLLLERGLRGVDEQERALGASRRVEPCAMSYRRSGSPASRTSDASLPSAWCSSTRRRLRPAASAGSPSLPSAPRSRRQRCWRSGSPSSLSACCSQA